MRNKMLPCCWRLSHSHPHDWPTIFILIVRYFSPLLSSDHNHLIVKINFWKGCWQISKRSSCFTSKEGGRRRKFLWRVLLIYKLETFQGQEASIACSTLLNELRDIFNLSESSEGETLLAPQYSHLPRFYHFCHYNSRNIQNRIQNKDTNRWESNSNLWWISKWW